MNAKILLHKWITSFRFLYFNSMSGPPEITTAYLERYVAQEGDTVKLVCPIIGTPRPIIEWYQVCDYISVNTEFVLSKEETKFN